MSFQWRSFLEFAEAILERASEFPDVEAVYRSVVSRAYYAVYCSARNVVKQKDKREFNGSVHQELQDYLLKHTDKARKRLGNHLRELHQLRKKADYEDKLNQPPLVLAKLAAKKARDIEFDLDVIVGKVKR